jgi:hypothetical protein
LHMPFLLLALARDLRCFYRLGPRQQEKHELECQVSDMHNELMYILGNMGSTDLVSYP